MANVAGAFGFKRWGTASSAPNFAGSGLPPYRISANYGTALFFGDAVRMNVSGPTGFIEQWAAADGGTATKILVGIFEGCRYYSTSQKKIIWNNYWPGSDATGDVEAFICDDPQSMWTVQANAGPIGYSAIGQTADVVVGSGNTTTGISAMALDTPTTTNTFPFKVVGLVTSPPGANGTDITSANNNVIVAFNNQQFKALLGV